MAVRASMIDLISDVRELIGDQDAAQYSDQQIQDALDANRTDLWNAPLEPQGTIGFGGTITYTHFYAQVGNIEKDAILYDAQYTALSGTLAPGTADYRRGYFNFAGSATSPYGPQRPVSIVGHAYQVPQAALSLVNQWAASVKAQIEYSDPNFTIKLGQQYGNLQALAGSIASKCPPVTVRVYRSD